MNLTPELREEYQRLWDSTRLTSREGWAGYIARAVEIAVSHSATYQRVEAATGVPWLVVAAIHMRESGARFDRHLHNGDLLTARTKRVPAGRPKKGKPPFSWEESAIDALEGEGLHEVQDWSIPSMLYHIEAFNGWGYRQYRDILSPYLWSGTNHYSRGKYVADGRYDANAVDAQIGCAAFLLEATWQGMLYAKQAAALVVYRAAPPPESERPIVRELQAWLQGAGLYSGAVDGWAGRLTSDAVQRLLGYYLSGDPRGDPAA